MVILTNLILTIDHPRKFDGKKPLKAMMVGRRSFPFWKVTVQGLCLTYKAIYKGYSSIQNYYLDVPGKKLGSIVRINKYFT